MVTPIDLQFPDQPGAPGFYEFVYGLLIPLLLFMPAIISAALIIDLITEEYEHHTLETLLSAPLSMGTIIWGKILACFVLVPIQAGAWIVLLALNRIPISSVPLVMIHVMLVSLFLILFGALIALYYQERTGAQVIFSLAVVVLMLTVLATPGNPFNQVAVLHERRRQTRHHAAISGSTSQPWLPHDPQHRSQCDPGRRPRGARAIPETLGGDNAARVVQSFWYLED